VTLGLDPGPVTSALALYDRGVGLCSHYRVENSWLLEFLRVYDAAPDDVLVIEQIASYGMPVGAEVFATCVVSGRFYQEWTRRGLAGEWLTRNAVKMHLCGQPRAKDANVRQALVDRFGGPAALKKGGPLYKVAGDSWSALAVAVTWADRLSLGLEKPSASK